MAHHLHRPVDTFSGLPCLLPCPAGGETPTSGKKHMSRPTAGWSRSADVPSAAWVIFFQPCLWEKPMNMIQYDSMMQLRRLKDVS